jgi:hypothetical protein
VYLDLQPVVVQCGGKLSTAGEKRVSANQSVRAPLQHQDEGTPPQDGFDQMRLYQLKEECRRRELNSDGSKAELEARLRDPSSPRAGGTRQRSASSAAEAARMEKCLKMVARRELLEGTIACVLMKDIRPDMTEFSGDDRPELSTLLCEVVEEADADHCLLVKFATGTLRPKIQIDRMAPADKAQRDQFRAEEEQAKAEEEQVKADKQAFERDRQKPKQTQHDYRDGEAVLIVGLTAASNYEDLNYQKGKVEGTGSLPVKTSKGMRYPVSVGQIKGLFAPENLEPISADTPSTQSLTATKWKIGLLIGVTVAGVIAGPILGVGITAGVVIVGGGIGAGIGAQIDETTHVLIDNGMEFDADGGCLVAASAASVVPRAPLATVSGTEVRQDPDGRGEYTVFNLCVRWAGASHMLPKRWSECYRLHEALEKELGGLSARSCWPKGLELQRKTKRCSVDDEKRIEKRVRELTAYFRDVGEWAGSEAGIDVPTVSQVWAEFCAPVDPDRPRSTVTNTLARSFSFLAGAASSGTDGNAKQEKRALKESLRVHNDGTLPDTSSVLVKIEKTRERSLPGGIGAPRGTVTEYAIDLLIQAPGEQVHVVRCGHA